MAQKDIFKIDNYFIGIGIFLIIISAISIFADPRTYYDLTLMKGSSFSFDNLDGRTIEDFKSSKGNDVEIIENGFPLIRTLVGLNGFILLAIGMYYRSIENKIINIWDALEVSGEAKVNNLSLSLGISRAFILNHLKDINAQKNVYYVLDVEHDKIVDGKLMAEYTVSGICTGCAQMISGKVSLHTAILPKCNYCGTPLSSDDLNKLKQDVLANRHLQQPIVAEGSFSVAAFVGLLIFFWPGAIVYLIVKKGNAIKKYSNQFQNLQQQLASNSGRK